MKQGNLKRDFVNLKNIELPPHPLLLGWGGIRCSEFCQWKQLKVKFFSTGCSLMQKRSRCEIYKRAGAVFNGFCARKTKAITLSFRKALMDFILNFILPCNIIKSFMVEFDKRDYYNNDRYQWDLAKLLPNGYDEYITAGVYPGPMIRKMRGSNEFVLGMGSTLVDRLVFFRIQWLFNRAFLQCLVCSW